MFRSNRLSRWAVTAAGCAVIDFIAVQVLLVGRLVGPTRPPLLHGPFAAFYLVIACGLVLLTFGALLQWVPASGTPLPYEKLPPAALTALQTGVAAIVAGLSALWTHIAQPAPYLLLAGAAQTTHARGTVSLMRDSRNLT